MKLRRINFLGFTLSWRDRGREDASREMNKALFNLHIHAPSCIHCGARPLIFETGRKLNATDYEAVCYACKRPQ